MVSVENASRYRAAIVQLINGDADPAGPGPKEYPGRFQPIHCGSHMLVDDRDGLLNLGVAITIHAFIMPTTPGKGVQRIVTRWEPARRSGWALVIDERGRLALWIGDGGSDWGAVTGHCYVRSEMRSTRARR